MRRELVPHRVPPPHYDDPMNTILALCITAIFSAWIYSLKQELNDVQRRLSPSSHGAASHGAHCSANGVTTNGKSPAKNHHYDTAVKSREHGVATWVIE